MKNNLLILVGVAVLTTAFLAGRRAPPNPIHDLQQRVLALEQTVAAQQTDLDKLRPLGEAISVYEHSVYIDRTLNVPWAGIFTHHLYYTGELRHFD